MTDQYEDEIAKPDYRRNLPHFTPNDAPYFLTYNLDGALPSDIRAKLLSGDSKFKDFDDYLDRVAAGPDWLAKPEVAGIVMERLNQVTEEVLTMHAFTIMSNHVHLMMSLHDGQSLDDLMQSVKGRTARFCNLRLDRRGAFWQHESYDRVLRWNEHQRVAKYIINNPVKAGLVGHWKEWPWTYLNRSLYFFDGEL
jgi:putative transposase